MPNMTKKWTPDPETAEIFATYAAAVRTERDLKPDVRERAQAALKDGATGTQLSRLTGMTPEVFRRMARDLELPIDPRYRERAEASRRKPKPEAVEQAVPEANERPSPPADLGVDPRVAALSEHRLTSLAGWLSDKRPDWYAEATAGVDAEWAAHVAVTKAVPRHLREIDLVG